MGGTFGRVGFLVHPGEVTGTLVHFHWTVGASGMVDLLVAETIRLTISSLACSSEYELSSPML